MSQTGLFDLSARQEQLSRKGDPLERLNEVIDWEDFRPLLKKVRPKPGPQGGRPPYDGVLLFKMLALASLYGLSDEQLEYQVKDRLSFMRFLGLDLQDRVPDATTIWLFREALGSKSGLLDKLFQRFERHLRKAGYEARGGQIIDASLVEVPTLRGKPDDDHEPRSRQQDRDAYMDAASVATPQLCDSAVWQLVERGRISGL
ncbi:MAG: transposase [Gammaproteobacteria bacterium]|nr:transposase [Gammaproteobacteria bacterium]MYG67299.1 transposase [Gammaproteobacteria bacterium]